MIDRADLRTLRVILGGCLWVARVLVIGLGAGLFIGFTIGWRLFA